MRGGVKRNIFLRGSPTVEKRIGALIYIDFIDRQTLKFLCVPFEYLQKKRTKSYREGGVSTLNICKGIGTLNQKNPNVLPQGKLVFAGRQNPPRLSLLQKLKKDTLPLLFSTRLCTLQTSISLSLETFFDKPTPSTRYLSLFTSCPSTLQTPLSLSLKAFFWQTHPEQQKNNHTYKNSSCEKPILILLMISFNYHSVYVLQHPVPLSNVRFQLTKKTKRGFIMVFYVKIMRKEVFIVLVDTVSARSTTSILEVGCHGVFFFSRNFFPP